MDVSYMQTAGAFVLLAIPQTHHTVLAGARRGSLLPEAAVHRIAGNRYRFRQQLEAAALPLRFHGLVYVPAANQAVFVSAAKRWNKSFRRLCGRLRRDWDRLTRLAWDEEFSGLVATWQRGPRQEALDVFLGPMRSAFEAGAAKGLVAENLTYVSCSLSAASFGGDSSGMPLDAAVHRYLKGARTACIETVAARLERLSERSIAYCESSIEFARSRRYLRVFRSLPIDCWIAWFELLHDPAVDEVRRLRTTWSSLQPRQTTAQARPVMKQCCRAAAATAMQLRRRLPH